MKKTLSTVVLLSALASTAMALPVINDDYARARAEANRRKVPLFVEVWAPW
jgi:hypothetical protein